MRPISDRVIIMPHNPETHTKGGLIIPDTAKEKALMGLVVRIGPHVVQIKEGDTVLFGKFAGTEIEHDGAKWLVMREDDVLAVLDSPKVWEPGLSGYVLGVDVAGPVSDFTAIHVDRPQRRIQFREDL